MQMNCKLLPLISHSTNRSSLTHKNLMGSSCVFSLHRAPKKLAGEIIQPYFQNLQRRTKTHYQRFGDFFIFAIKSGELFIVSLNVVLGYCTPCWEFAEHFNVKYTYAYRESAQSTVLWSRADYFVDKMYVFAF